MVEIWEPVDPSTLLSPENPLWQRPFDPSESFYTSLSDQLDESLEYHLWQTWLRWIPGPYDAPLGLSSAWMLQRHPIEPVAVLYHRGLASFYDGMHVVPTLPMVEEFPFDRLRTLIVIGLTSGWKQILMACDDPIPTWADAIVSVLMAWQMVVESYVWTFSPTPWTYEGKHCVFMDGNPSQISEWL